MEEFYTREMALVKAPCTHEERKLVIETAKLFRAEIKRAEESLLIIQVTGRPEAKKVDAFIERIQEIVGDVEVQRTQPVTINWEKAGVRNFEEVVAV